MLQHADHVRLVEEHLARHLGPVGVGVFFDLVDLDRNVAAIIRIVRQVDRTGAAPANLVDDDVFADFLGNVTLGLQFAYWTGHVVPEFSGHQVLDHVSHL